jgi:mycofactocin precursor
MEAGMWEQALFEAAPAQPMLTADESAREPLAEEVAIGGICGVY